MHWDRRGTGKSFVTDAGWVPLVRANLSDLHALAVWLYRVFPHQKLILVGHSWGTYLGILAIRERPDLYDAYVGTGQMATDHKGDDAVRIPFFRREAERRGDKVWNTPSALAAQYFAHLDAPRKRIVWFQNSAHFPFLDEPERFANELLTIDHKLAR